MLHSGNEFVQIGVRQISHRRFDQHFLRKAARDNLDVLNGIFDTQILDCRNAVLVPAFQKIGEKFMGQAVTNTGRPPGIRIVSGANGHHRPRTLNRNSSKGLPPAAAPHEMRRKVPAGIAPTSPLGRNSSALASRRLSTSSRMVSISLSKLSSLSEPTRSVKSLVFRF